MASAGRGSAGSLHSDRSSVCSVGSTQHFDAEANGGGELGGFGLLLRPGVSQRLETQGQSIFFAAKVDKGGPAYSAGMRAEDMIMSVDGQRLKTWDDAARLLLGSLGTSAAVAWHSQALGQHKSARLRRAPASPLDLEVLMCQQRERRSGSSRGSSKGVFSQASAGWKWLKKQAGKDGRRDSDRTSEGRSERSGGRDSVRGDREEGREKPSSSRGQRVGDDVEVTRPSVSSSAGRHSVSSSVGSAPAAAPSANLPASPLTTSAVAMWTDTWHEGREGSGAGAGEMASHERVVMHGYLRHAVDLAREGSARGWQDLSHELPASLGTEDSVQTSARGSESGGSVESGAEDDAGSMYDESRGGWKKKVKKAMGRVVKEVSVLPVLSAVIGTDKPQGPQLSRSTLQGHNAGVAGVGVTLAQGDKGSVVVADVAPWIWAGKHGLAFPISVGDIVTHIDDKRLPPGASFHDVMRMLEGEHGTWVAMQLAGPTQGLVDMIMIDINGAGGSNKQKTYLAGERHKYSVQLMRQHPPAAPASAVRKVPPALHQPSPLDDNNQHVATQRESGKDAVPERATVVLENAVAGMHKATARMSGTVHSPATPLVGGVAPVSVRAAQRQWEAERGLEVKPRGMERLQERARESNLLEEQSGPLGIKGVQGRRRRERTGIIAGLKTKGKLLRQFGALCSTSGACGAVDDKDMNVRDWVWDEKDEEEFLRDEADEKKVGSHKGTTGAVKSTTGAVARFLQRATKDRGSSHSGGERGSKCGARLTGVGGGVPREMSLKAVRSRGSVFRQESDGIAEMSFAGFPAELGEAEEEVSDYSEEEGEDDEEEMLARASADFVAERPHEIDLRVGQVVVVLTRHESGWWEGCLASGEGRTGWFPSNHVQVLPRPPREKKKKDGLGASSATKHTGGQIADEFMPGLDYREASWADDAHTRRLQADNINYKEASWAAFPRALTEEELRVYADSVAPPVQYASEDSEDTEDTYDDDDGESLGQNMAKGRQQDHGMASGWLQQDLFHQRSASSDGVPAANDGRRSGRGSYSGAGNGWCRSTGEHLTSVEEGHLTAVEEGHSNGVWRVQVSDVGDQDVVASAPGAGLPVSPLTTSAVVMWTGMHKNAAGGRASVGSLRHHFFSKVPYIVALHSKNTRALTFEIFCLSAGGGRSHAGVGGGGSLSEHSRGSLREHSRSSIASSAAVSIEEAEEVLQMWAPGRMYEWLVSIDLEMYGDALQMRGIAGTDMASLLHMSEDAADAQIEEWGVHNKYHRRRFLRKLLASFRLAADDAHEKGSADGSVADLPQLPVPTLPPVPHREQGLNKSHQVDVAEEAEARAAQAKKLVPERSDSSVGNGGGGDGGGAASAEHNSCDVTRFTYLVTSSHTSPHHHSAEHSSLEAEEEAAEEWGAEAEEIPVQAAPPPPTLPSQAHSVGTPSPLSNEDTSRGRGESRSCCMCEQEEEATSSCDHCGSKFSKVKAP